MYIYSLKNVNLYKIIFKCLEEQLEELQGNMMKTCWEHIGNKKKTKNNSSHPTPKMKKQGPSCMHVEPSHWLHEISLSKIVGHHFQPRFIPPL